MAGSIRAICCGAPSDLAGRQKSLLVIGQLLYPVDLAMVIYLIAKNAKRVSATAMVYKDRMDDVIRTNKRKKQ